MPPDEPEDVQGFDQALLAYDRALSMGCIPPPVTAEMTDPQFGEVDALESCRQCLLWLEAFWPRNPDSRVPRGTAAAHAAAERAASADGAVLTANLPGAVLGPFVILEELGRGGMGVVYKALDQRRQIHVALKMLHAGGHAAVRRLKREFRVLADIVHPNLVLLEELYCLDERWFFTMELVEGQPFADYVRADSSPVDGLGSVPTESPITPSASWVAERSPPLTDARQFARLRSALVQIADGLSSLHRGGILHRDIKPSNVLVTAEGRVVLVDFGLASDLQKNATPGRRRTEVAGTWHYMSPEQSSDESLSAASDWYSVGVMLWEVLTGQRPFEGDSAEILSQKLAGPPSLEEGLVPQEQADLALLCRQLLQPDAAVRPCEEKILRQLRPDTPTDVPPSPCVVPESIFIGREEPLGRLLDAYAASKSEQLTCVLVHGPPGIGKTALVERFLQQIEPQEDVLVLRGRCYERESVPYQALDSIVDDLTDRLAAWPHDELRRLLPANLGPLLQVFPALGRVVEGSGLGAHKSVAGGGRQARELAVEVLRDLMRRLAAQRPVVLIVDDLQWGDADGAALLVDLITPPHPPPLLLVTCYRSKEAVRNQSLQQFLDTLPGFLPREHRFEIVLGPLSEQETRQLAKQLLAQTDSDTARAVEVARESDGNPYFVGELVRHVVRAPGRVPGEVDLETILAERIGQLSGPAQHLLDLLSVAGHPVRYLDACRAAGVESQPRLLAQLCRERLVRTSGDGTEPDVEPYHDRVRETVAMWLSGEKQREHHWQLATALEAASGTDPQLLFMHFDTAGDLRKAAHYVLPAAERAAADLAFEQASRLYRRALELGAVAVDRIHMVRKCLAEALADAGHAIEAAREYEAAALGFSGTTALELRRRAADYLLRAGRLNEGCQVLSGVLDAVGLRMPRSYRDARLMSLWNHLRLRLRGTRYRERPEHEISREEILRLDTCWSAAMVVIMDTLLGLPFATKFPLLALEAGEPSRVSQALVHIAVIRAWNDRRQDVGEIFRQAESLARRVENPQALGWVRMNAGYIHLMRGQWQTALRCGDEAVAILSQQSAAAQLDRSATQVLALSSLFFLGQIGELSRRVPPMIENARRHADAISAAVPYAFFGNIAWLAIDDAERARHGARAVLDRFPPDRFLQQHVFELIGSLQTDLYLGEGCRAWERLAQSWPKFRKSFYASNPFYRPVLHHLRARAALASLGSGQNDRDLIRSALRDAKCLQRERIAWCDPLAGLTGAGAAAGRGDNKTAVDLLRQVISQFDSAEMGLFAAVSRRRMGELLGDEEGRSLVRQADAWMASQSIRVPWRFAAMLAPGFAVRS
ncbi:MAG: serine/threonine-protein kinase [Pirellulaceae bacterium]